MSTFTPPSRILIKSDSNEIELRQEIKDKKQGVLYLYQFTKSKENLNSYFEIKESDLKKNLENKVFTEL